MLRNYLTIAMRNLIKHKLYTVINISGLAVGIAFCVLTFLFVKNEWTYDTFHEGADHIYRIYGIGKSPGEGETPGATAPDPLALTLRGDFPDLPVVRLTQRDAWVVVDGKPFKETVHYTDQAFFDVFTFPLSQGDSETLLNDPSSVVVTERIAEKYFGGENPIGRILSIDEAHDFIVMGVLEAIPPNSSIQFDILASVLRQDQIDPDHQKRWWSSGTFTYVRCSGAFPPEKLESHLSTIREKHFPDFLKDRTRLAVQPLTSIHLNAQTRNEMVAGRAPVDLYILSAIALSVLLIACFNFMNLSTARYAERAREIGMRKVLGARRIQVVRQFLGEALFLSFFSLCFAIALVELFLPHFCALVGKELVLDYGNNALVILGLLGFGVLVGFLSGLYPAFYLSADQPVVAIKGQSRSGRGGMQSRQVLVIAQFGVSIALIVSELVVIQQVQYMKNQDLGFNPEQVVAIPIQVDDRDGPLPRIAAFLNAIRAEKTSGISAVCLTENLPGLHYSNKFGVTAEAFPEGTSLEMVVTSMDEHTLETYEMDLVDGRNFSAEFRTDRSQAVLLNETAVARLGWQPAVGKKIKYVHGDGPFTVIGVVKDSHFKTLQSEIEPVVYRYTSNKYRIGYLSARIRPEHTREALALLKEKWQTIVQSQPFEYSFVDDVFDRNYRTEEETQKVIGVFSLVAIFLACLGLFGLVAYAAQQRTKEIGVRKVLGASVSDIFLLLSGDFMKLVLIANLIAWPIAYYALSNWLEHFAYRIDLGPGTLTSGSVLVLLIALLTTSYQAIRAALADPVDALRYE